MRKTTDRVGKVEVEVSLEEVDIHLPKAWLEVILRWAGKHEPRTRRHTDEARRSILSTNSTIHDTKVRVGHTAEGNRKVQTTLMGLEDPIVNR